MQLYGDTLVRSNPERKWDARKGWSSVEKVRGEYIAVCNFAAQQIGRFSSVSISPEEGGIATCTLTNDSPDTASKPVDPDEKGQPAADTETWTLAGNDLEKDIWTHKRIMALSRTDYDWLKLNTKLSKEKGTWHAVYNAIQNQELKKMFRLLVVTGAEKYSVSQFVLKRSVTTSNQKLGSFSPTGVNIQYETQQLITLEKVPNGLRFSVPQGAWIKRTPTVTFDGAKWSCETEWWHADEWSEILYPKHNTPEAAEPAPVVLPPALQTKPPVISSVSVAPNSLLQEGLSATFTAAATGLDPMQYFWYNGATVIGSGASITVPATLDMTTIVCTVVNAGGSASASVAMTIFPAGISGSGTGGSGGAP